MKNKLMAQKAIISKALKIPVAIVFDVTIKLNIRG
jgi:hypothetical protein